MERFLTALSLAVATTCVAGESAWSQELVRIDAQYYCAAEPGPVPDELHTFPPTRAAERAVQEIADLAGVGTSGWRLRASAQDKASAFMDPVSGERTIVYNQDFITSLRGESDSVWANVAILAHEIAHHLNNHLQTGDSRTRRSEELEADSFAGFVLARKGASREATERVFRALGGGGDYPAVRDRVTAAQNGWLRANPPPPTPPPPTPPPPTPLSVSGLTLFSEHRASVFHGGGGVPGPGFGFLVGGSLTYANPADVTVGVYITFADGRILIPDVREGFYRSLRNGGVVTGSRNPVLFRGGVLDLRAILIDPIPYYVLNLRPTNYQMTYYLSAYVVVFLDGGEVARSAPVPLVMRW